MTETKQRESRKRLAIGYLTPWIGAPVFRAMWAGVDDVARQYDANLLCFPGASLQNPSRRQQRNVLYSLITRENLDGLIMSSDALAVYISPEEFEAFYQKYRPLPMVSTARALEGIPSVLVDNREGMRSAVVHLIETHGLNRIAFIRGPAGQQEAEQRYRAYTEILAEHGLPLDPALVVPGDFSTEAGRQAIHVLLDQRKLLPGTGVEAVIAANDGMALGALEALESRGMQVPGDVALVGFDDMEIARYTVPPLTTVRNPLYEVGVQAAEMLLAQIEGRDVPECVVLPSKLVVRRSCGCVLPIVTRAAAGPVIHPPAEELRVPLSARRGSILAAIAQAVDVPVERVSSEWAERLLDAFITEMEGEAEEPFLPVLEGILGRAAAASLDLSAWQDVLSALRRHALPYLNGDDRSRAEDLLSQARVLVGDMAQRCQGHQVISLTRQVQMLPDIDYALGSRFDMAELLNVAAQEIPGAGILSCYISLFEDPEAPTDWSRLILAQDRGRRIDLEAGGRRFPSLQLVPDGLLPAGRRYNLVLEPLQLRDRLLGFALFEAEPAQGEICEILRRQISSALQGVLLLQAREEAEAALERAYSEVERQVEERTAELHQEVADRKQVEEALKHRLEQLAALSQASRAVTASLELDQVLAEIVYLASEVVGSDYTGVLLVDEAGNMGQSVENLPGVQALEYRIRDEGLTHWIVRVRRAAVIDRIEEDGTMYPTLNEGAPSVANPLIVQAGIKSLAGLPLMVKDRLLGVLYLHSLNPNAFDGQLFLLTAFANQAAIAIENARLFQAKQHQTRRLALLADVARIAATTFDSGALLQAVAGSIRRHLAYPLVGLFTLDDEGQTLTCRGLSVIPEALSDSAFPEAYQYPVEQGILGYVACTGQPYMAPDTTTDPLFQPSPIPDIRSELCVPILEEGGLVGVVDVESGRLAAFNEEDQALLEAVADTVAIGLRNARLYQETRRRVQELTLLNTISVGPGATLDVDALIENALEGLHGLVEADRVTFITVDPGTRNWKITHQRVAPGIEPSIGSSGTFGDASTELKALLDGQSFIISDTTTDPRIEVTRELYRSLETRSVLMVSVKVSGRLYGILGVGCCHERHGWRPDEARLLEAVAQQLGLVLENAHLFEEAQLRADELAAALARLEEMDRLKDEFIQSVSHEFRSPLALIRGYAEMLDSGELGEIPDEQQKPVTVIARRARMLSDLVKDITLILEAEVSPPEPVPVPLDELARNAVEDFQVETEQAELTLRAEIKPDLPLVSGEPTYLRRVLDNLLGNAVKFTPAGGTITVRLRREEAQVALEVNDTGVGIPPDKLERIFDRFYQVDGSARRRYGGVGLGLALVKEIVETYGGHVMVESRIDEGSTFTAFFPIFVDAGGAEA